VWAPNGRPPDGRRFHAPFLWATLVDGPRGPWYSGDVLSVDSPPVERRRDMKRLISMFAVALLFLAAASAQAGGPGFGSLYYEGEVVRTIVPPAASPNEGVDDLYAIQGGVPDQLAVIAVAPGDPDFHGGHWAFHSVTWNVAPYLLTSEDDIFTAAGVGDVTITRVPQNDFLCPVQP